MGPATLPSLGQYHDPQYLAIRGASSQVSSLRHRFERENEQKPKEILATSSFDDARWFWGSPKFLKLPFPSTSTIIIFFERWPPDTSLLKEEEKLLL